MTNESLQEIEERRKAVEAALAKYRIGQFVTLPHPVAAPIAEDAIVLADEVRRLQARLAQYEASEGKRCD